MSTKPPLNPNVALTLSYFVSDDKVMYGAIYPHKILIVLRGNPRFEKCILGVNQKFLSRKFRGKIKLQGFIVAQQVARLRDS